MKHRGTKRKARRRVPGGDGVKELGSSGFVYGYCRYATERMMRMHRAIEDKEYPNSRTFAREFEVSVRTVKRDVDFMKTRLKMPIAFDVLKNGYYFTVSVPHLPRLPLTEKEIVGLFVAQKAIAQYQGTSLQPVLDSAFKKMTAQLDDSVKYSLGGLDEVLSIRQLAPGDAELETFEILTRAVRERRAVRFIYRKHGEVKQARKCVHPYHVAYVNNQWTLFARDPRAGDVPRKFILARLSKPKLTAEGFTVAEKFDLEKELSGSMGVFKGKDDYTVIVDFDAWGADDVRGRRWHSSQELIELSRGMLRVKLRLNSLEEVERWVLGFGRHATVVGPDELRQRLFKATHELFERYGGPMVIAGRDEG